MFILRVILFMVLFFVNCNGMDSRVEKSRDLTIKSYTYSEFFSSENDKKVILDNYAKAIKACKDALKQLNEQHKTDRKLNRRHGLSHSEAISVWKRQLNCLEREEDMRNMVDSGVLPIYIFEVIKKEVFEKE